MAVVENPKRKASLVLFAAIAAMGCYEFTAFDSGNPTIGSLAELREAIGEEKAVPDFARSVRLGLINRGDSPYTQHVIYRLNRFTGEVCAFTSQGFAAGSDQALDAAGRWKLTESGCARSW